MSQPPTGSTELSYGRIAMLSMSILLITELNAGSPIINVLQGLDIKAIWWALGIYA